MAIRSWAAQLAGGIVGALILWALVSGAPTYFTGSVGLGADGFGSHSMIGIGAGGAFAVEVVLTLIFVFVVLGATSRIGSPGAAGLAIGVARTCVHLVGIPLTGTSVNPARSLGPEIIVGSSALKQPWLFIVAPLVGGALAAFGYRRATVGGPRVHGACRARQRALRRDAAPCPADLAAPTPEAESGRVLALEERVEVAGGVAEVAVSQSQAAPLTPSRRPASRSPPPSAPAPRPSLPASAAGRPRRASGSTRAGRTGRC